MSDEVKPWIEKDGFWLIAGLFAFIASMISLYNIYKHLYYWNKPVFQLWIVRVLFIIPVYAMISFISIKFEKVGLYLELIRDCYEAYVIYCFLLWILNVIGGEQACGASISKRMFMKHPIPLCCLPEMRLNAKFLRVCKQMTLQFVFMKPISSVISITLLIIDKGNTKYYLNPYWQIIVTTIYNVSYTLALYGLFLFYLATKNEMIGHSPVKKFLAVKCVIWLTYWQLMLIPLVFGKEFGDKYNDFILCVEMLFFSILHYKAFPWYEFKWNTIPVSNIEYKNTNFTGLDEQHMEQDIFDSNNTNNNNNNKSEPLIMDDNKYDTYNTNQCSIYSWCSALYEVINICDTCDDAYRNFNVKKFKKSISELDQDSDSNKLNSFIDTKKDAITLDNIDEDLNFENIISNKKKLSLSDDKPQIKSNKNKPVKPTVQLIPSDTAGLKIIDRQKSQ